MLSSLQQRRDLLAGTPIFASASLKLLGELAARASMVTLAENQSLFMKGDPGERLYVVVSGLIHIGAMSPDGREVSYYILGRGDVLGEIAVLDGGQRSADAKAVKDSVLLAVERRDIIALLDQYPAQAIKLVQLLCARLRRADELLDDMAFLPLSSRLAKYLLTLAKMVGMDAKGAGPAEIRLSQKVLAEHLGITRESVNKVLSKWDQAGIVTLGRGRILINQVAQLREIASPG
jgi:CRP-like cAMP-binding protein